MNLNYSIALMFLISFIIQYFVMSYIMNYNFLYINNNLGKIYLSIIVALLFVLYDIFLYDLDHKTIHKYHYIITLLLLILVIVLYRTQYGINIKNYLLDIIEHNSILLQKSYDIIDKTKDPDIKEVIKDMVIKAKQEIYNIDQIIETEESI
jgi:hypothetical protein